MRFIPCDDELSLRGQPLQDAISRDREEGLIPFYVCWVISNISVKEETVVVKIFKSMYTGTKYCITIVLILNSFQIGISDCLNKNLLRIQTAEVTWYQICDFFCG